MSEKRAKLLVMYMDKYQEQFPDMDSAWIRRKAEAKVEQHLDAEATGDLKASGSASVPPPSLPPVYSREAAGAPPSPGYPRSSEMKKGLISQINSRSTELIFLLLAAITFVIWIVMKLEHVNMESQGAIKSAMQQSQLLAESRNLMLWFSLFMILAVICNGVRLIVEAIGRIPRC